MWAGAAGVVEDDPERGAAAGGDGADPVAHADAVVAALAGVGPHLGREDQERAARRAQHVGAALRARPLLEQHELAARVVVLVGEHRHDLEREVDVAVEVLVQRVPVALAVAEDQRRRPLLPGGAAALEQLLVLGRKGVGGAAQPLRPAVGDRRQVAVEARAQRRDRLGERVVEVAVAAVAEAVACHVEGGAESAVVEQRGEVVALGGVEQRLGDRKPVTVEAFVEGGPVEGVGGAHVGGTRSGGGL